jgi:carbamoyl-phosphate synthase large subunit
MKVFLTGIGGDIAQSIAGILLEELRDVEIWGSDQNLEFANLSFLKGFFLSPKDNEKSYVDWVSDIVSRNDFDFYFPIPESEIQQLALSSTERLDFISSKTKIIWAGSFAIKKFTSKFETHNFLLELGFAPPKTVRKLSHLREFDFPVIVKPDFGRGSKGIFLCNNHDEVSAAISLTSSPIIQEYIPNEESEYTCGIFRNKILGTKVIVLRRLLKDGSTIWGEVVKNLEIEKVCHIVAESIDLAGSINVQLRLKGSRIAIFEINPRFSSTVGFRHKVGFTDLLWSLSLPQFRDTYSNINALGTKFYIRKNIEILEK